MSLWSLITGVDTEAEQARGAALDAQIAANQQANLDSGKWTQDQYDAAAARAQAGATGDVTSQLNDTAVEGAVQGLQNDVQLVKDAATSVADGVNSTLSFGVGTIFRAIPISVWIIAVIVIFFWMGGATLLKGRLAKS